MRILRVRHTATASAIISRCRANRRTESGRSSDLHHIKIPVTDLIRSREWYERVFELESLTEFRDDDGVVRSVVYRS